MKPENMNLASYSRAVDRWIVVGKLPDLIVRFPTRRERDTFIMQMNLVRRAVEIQERAGEPWMRHVSMRKLDDQTVKFVHVTQQDHLIEFPDGSKYNTDDALDRAFE